MLVQPYDKFGKRIYPNIFHKLQETGDKLLTLGYDESSKKPNLFYLNKGNITFFADMRGTEQVQIWEDTRPLIYWKSNTNHTTANALPDNSNKEISIKSIFLHFEELGQNGIESRISFPMESEPGTIIFENDTFIQEYMLSRFNIPEFLSQVGFRFYEQKGVCYHCGIRFSAPGFFCSEECRFNYIKRFVAQALNSSKEFCEVCKSRILDKNIFEEYREYLGDLAAKPKKIIHHLSYSPETTISVCDECHYKIHHTDDYPELQPKPGESRRFYNKNSRPTIFCGWCGYEWKSRKEIPVRCPHCKNKYITAASSAIGCPHCSGVYPSQSEWRNHLKTVRAKQPSMKY